MHMHTARQTASHTHTGYLRKDTHTHTHKHTCTHILYSCLHTHMNTHTHTKAHGRPHTYTHRTTHVKLLLTGPCCCGRSPADCGWDPATSSCCCTSHGPHLEKICEQSGGSRSVVLNAVPIHAQFSAPINHTHTHTHTHLQPRDARQPMRGAASCQAPRALLLLL
jgi:hypothetical protein